MIRPKPESDMQFVFYNEDDFFPIEDAIKNIGLEKVRTVEYVYFMGKNICLIEAKSSSPRPDVSSNNVKYEKFITEIIEKITHSINILFGGITNYRDLNLPNNYYNKKYNEKNILVLLVIKGHKQQWMSPIEKDLKIRLKSYIIIWRMDIKVINDETAMEKNYIEK